MIKAQVKDGVLQPLDPLPPEWEDGRELQVDEAAPVADSERLDEWSRELTELGAAVYEPGEREQVAAIMREADEQAKEIVRRQMGLRQ